MSNKDILVNRLNNRIDVYDKTKSLDKLNETVYTWGKIKSVWAEIIPYKGDIKAEGEANISESLYKITIRVNAISNINDQMYFKYKGMRFDIVYFHPHFKERNLIELVCTVIVENSTDLGVTGDE
ncbi:phage head closure protein [Clostridium sp.]|uniref:phage head closure protein n=1 Tax=Clostridium sp. TaxID=1506 RepID=UPI00260B95D3|nr:phage head closure protein [Clostridium sp.]